MVKIQPKTTEEASQSKPSKRKFTKPTVAIKHKKVLDLMVENGGNVSKAIRDSGLYSPSQALHPEKILDSKTWNEIIEDALPDELLTEKHKELMNATRIDHLVFPLGPKDADDPNFSGGRKPAEAEMPEEHKERTTLTDKEIIEMLAEVNCKVRRIVHGETARHVYFWSNDNKSRKEALDMAYKLKGRYANEGNPNAPHGNTYNFIFSAPVQEKVKIIEGEIKELLVKPKPNVSEN